MGSFNAACAISKSPLRPGDKVRLMFIGTNEQYYGNVESKESLRRNGLFQGTTMYSSDTFRVLGGVSLQCTYEDYGNFELIEKSFFSEYLLDKIQEKQGADYDRMTFEEALEQIYEGQLFLHPVSDGEFSKIPYLNIMAIHEEVYQVLLNKDFYTWWWEEDGVKHPSGNRKLADFVRKEIKERAPSDVRKTERFVELYEIFSRSMTPEQADEIAYSMAELDNRIRSRSDSYDRWKFCYGAETPYHEMTEYNNKRTDEERAEFPITDEEMITRMMEAYVFNIAMDTNHYQYLPGGLSGQEYDLAPYANTLIDIARAVIATNNREDDEKLPTRTVVSHYSEISLDAIKASVVDWYDDTESDYARSWYELIADFENQFEVLKTDTIIITKEQLQTPEYEDLREVVPNGADLKITR